MHSPPEEPPFSGEECLDQSPEQVKKVRVAYEETSPPRLWKTFDMNNIRSFLRMRAAVESGWPYASKALNAQGLLYLP